jgi:NADPH2:quinone reductase
MAGREARPPFPVGPFYVKGCALRGFVMFMATPDEQRAAARDLGRWMAAGQVKPRIDRVPAPSLRPPRPTASRN